VPQVTEGQPWGTNSAWWRLINATKTLNLANLSDRSNRDQPLGGHYKSECLQITTRYHDGALCLRLFAPRVSLVDQGTDRVRIASLCCNDCRHGGRSSVVLQPLMMSHLNRMQ